MHLASVYAHVQYALAWHSMHADDGESRAPSPRVNEVIFSAIFL